MPKNQKNTQGLRKGIHRSHLEGQEGQDPDPEPEDEQERPPVEPPAAYPLDEALAEAFDPSPGAWHLPQHTDDLEEQQHRSQRQQPSDRAQPETSDSSQPATATAAPAQSGSSGPAPLNPAGSGAPASVTGTPAQPPFFAPASISSPETAAPEAVAAALAAGQIPILPESLADRMARLPSPWLIRYVYALMELGGEHTLARSRGRLSKASVEKAMAQCPDFALACHEAQEHSTGLLRAAVYQSATVGDVEPVYRGVYLVGYKRVKSIKAAELLLKIRGEMPTSQREITVRGNVTVDAVPDEQIPALVSAVMAKLFSGQRGRPVIDAEARAERIGDNSV